MGDIVNSGKRLSFVASLAAFAALPVAAVTPVVHQVSPQPSSRPFGCAPSDPIYAVSAPAPSWWASGPSKSTFGPSGVRITVSVTSGYSYSGSIGGSGSFDISAIVAKAQATISAAISYTNSTSVSQSASYVVPSDWAWGWLAYGSAEYNISWTEYLRRESCSLVEVASGSGHLPTRFSGFNKGEGIGPSGTFSA